MLHCRLEIKNDSFEKVEKSGKYEESEDQFYYDIPIKDFKKKTQNITREPEITYSTNNINDKKKIIDEILKESTNFTSMDKERPFTPPFNKLIPLNSTKSLERIKNNINSNNNNEIVDDNNDNHNLVINTNRLLDSLDPNTMQVSKENIADFIYDHVLGCYYDPKHNIYYELK